MPGAISRLEGMGPSLKALRQLSDHVQKKVGKIALKAGAQPLVTRVKGKAKVSSRADNPTPGSLRQSVHDKPGRPSRGMDTRAIIADDVAAVPKEFGLARRDYPAEPFFRPAVDAGRAEAGQAIADAIKNEVENGPWVAAKG